ncbi:hypothetical protein COEREDRAFT_7949 [Coemansia reversa NRRL 1564]|uniref:Uncharacterized protein n=1 Tax=Coemansia reversa (strain ATCC 12441 / NRRL 1564) TaxID=763665 RepID=A0A2G5BCQ9_COERN|nr:hypothetical protein COEREDRAFT_7949 [Coemansia reversa NRRL 1564]|eukprot:PIA16800.1 hypothetical protein COEREDRAFT_7949 [Coemansia reversa NRRL 1564]
MSHYSLKPDHIQTRSANRLSRSSGHNPFCLPRDTPIRSNWYHAEETLRESDLEDQEFYSSDEEDFMSPTRGYRGDIPAQQRLIKHQQRELFDINMRCNMLAEAFKKDSINPYEALVANYGDCCKENRRAKSEIARLRIKVARLRSSRA